MIIGISTEYNSHVHTVLQVCHNTNNTWIRFPSLWTLHNHILPNTTSPLGEVIASFSPLQATNMK